MAWRSCLLLFLAPVMGIFHHGHRHNVPANKTHEISRSGKVAPFLLWPGNRMPPEHMAALLGKPVNRVQHNEMDLELFDSSVAMDKYDEIFQLYGSKKVNDAQKIMSLNDFIIMRPLLGMLPNIRSISDATSQFYYYSNDKETLNPVQLMNNAKKMGITIDQATASDMIGRLVYNATVECDGLSPCVSTCEYVLAVLRDADVLHTPELMEADRVFDAVVTSRNPVGVQDSTGKVITGREWLTHPATNAKHFRLKDFGYDSGAELDRLAKALSIMYRTSKIDWVEGTIDKCSHRLLHFFTSKSTRRFLPLRKTEQITPPSFHNNPLATWMIDGLGNQHLLQTTCRAPARDPCINVWDEPEKYETTFCRTNYPENQGCTLRQMLKESKVTLSQGIDAIFYANDDDGSLTLDKFEFTQTMRVLDIFQELAYWSTKNDLDTVTATQLPYLHVWYLAKGKTYTKNLMTQVASLSRNLLRRNTLKQFVEAIRFTDIDRVSSPGELSVSQTSSMGPLHLGNLQGLLNRVMGTHVENIARMLTNYQRPESRACEFLKEMSPFDRMSIATLIFDGTDDDAAALAVKETEFMNKYCEVVVGKGSTCSGSLCQIPDNLQASSTKSLNIVELLDAVMHGIPNFGNVPMREFKFLFRMLRGTDDAFDQITPERWLILASIMRAFDGVDADHSGDISEDEFTRNFGHCFSPIMSRFKLLADIDTGSLFGNVVDAWKLVSADIPNYQVMNDKSAGTDKKLRLHQFAILFSEFNYAGCVIDQCIRGVITETAKCKKILEESKDSRYISLYCSRKLSSGKLPAELQDFCGKSASEENAAIIQKLMDGSVKKCSPFGSISFESFLEPQFDEATRFCRTLKRAILCHCEPFQTTSVMMNLRPGGSLSGICNHLDAI